MRATGIFRQNTHITNKLPPCALYYSQGECFVSPAQPTRVNLEFKDVSLKLGGWQVARKEWAPGAMRGHWAATYWDDDFRVFTTNKGSLFVMARK